MVEETQWLIMVAKSADSTRTLHSFLVLLFWVEVRVSHHAMNGIASVQTPFPIIRQSRTSSSFAESYHLYVIFQTAIYVDAPRAGATLLRNVGARRGSLVIFLALQRWDTKRFQNYKELYMAVR